MVILFNFVVIALSPVGWGSVDNSLRVKRAFFDFVTHEAGDEQAFDNHPTVDRVLIELSILAWCRRMQRMREDDAGKVSACSITGYPDIRSVPIYDIRTDEKIDWFDFVVTLMHTVTPEVQSEACWCCVVQF